jgi:hypothetical protein
MDQNNESSTLFGLTLAPGREQNFSWCITKPKAVYDEMNLITVVSPDLRPGNRRYLQDKQTCGWKLCRDQSNLPNSSPEYLCTL